MGEKMTRVKFFLLLIVVGLVAFTFAACRPSIPSYSPNPGIESHGATPQYSYFGYAQIQYPQEKKDVIVNRPDNGQGVGDAADASGETGFVFDF